MILSRVGSPMILKVNARTRHIIFGNGLRLGLGHPLLVNHPDIAGFRCTGSNGVIFDHIDLPEGYMND